MNKECKHYDLIGKGIWVGGIKGRYACVVPFCKKSNNICNYSNFNECESYE